MRASLHLQMRSAVVHQINNNGRTNRVGESTRTNMASTRMHSPVNFPARMKMIGRGSVLKVIELVEDTNCTSLRGQ